MILEPNRILFGCRSNATNLESMRRLGVAIYSPGYTLAQRRQIIRRTLDPSPTDPQLGNFQKIFVYQSVDVLVGHIQVTDTQWEHLSEFIRDLLADIGGATVKYIRFDLESGVSLLSNDHNFSELNPFVGSPMTIAEAMPIIGLTHKSS